MASIEIDSVSKPQKKSPVESTEPTAPIYTIEPFNDAPEVSYPSLAEEMPACERLPDYSQTKLEDSPKNVSDCPTLEYGETSKSNLQNPVLSVALHRLQIELELKKAQLKKEQLEKERKLVEQDFNVRTEIVNSEIELAMAKLDSLEVNDVPSSNSTAATAVVENATEKPVVLHDTKSIYPSSPTLDTVMANDRANELRPGNESVRQERIPPSVPTGRVLGQEQLRKLDCVTVRQLRSQHLDETYEVVAPGEDLVILRANVTVLLRGQKRALRLDLIDNEVKEVATFRAGRDEGAMELSVCGVCVGHVRRAHTYFRPMLVLHDALGAPALKIKGPKLDQVKHVFSVQTPAKWHIGHIDKSLARATPHYESNHAVLKFPRELDVRYKLALVAASFLIVDSTTSQNRERRLEAAIAAANRAYQPDQRAYHANHQAYQGAYQSDNHAGHRAYPADHRDHGHDRLDFPLPDY